MRRGRPARGFSSQVTEPLVGPDTLADVAAGGRLRLPARPPQLDTGVALDDTPPPSLCNAV